MPKVFLVANLDHKFDFTTKIYVQFPPDIQTVLRFIMLANTSFTTARGKSENWFVTGVYSMAYGAYFNMFSAEAAEKVIPVHY